MHRIFTTSVASVYPHYVAKVEKKSDQAELDAVIDWLTGFSEAELRCHLAEGTTFEEFFAAARLEPAGVVDHRLGLRDQGRGDRGPAARAMRNAACHSRSASSKRSSMK